MFVYITFDSWGVSVNHVTKSSACLLSAICISLVGHYEVRGSLRESGVVAISNYLFYGRKQLRMSILVFKHLKGHFRWCVCTLRTQMKTTNKVRLYYKKFWLTLLISNKLLSKKVKRKPNIFMVKRNRTKMNIKSSGNFEKKKKWTHNLKTTLADSSLNYAVVRNM